MSSNRDPKVNASFCCFRVRKPCLSSFFSDFYSNVAETPTLTPYTWFSRFSLQSHVLVPNIFNLTPANFLFISRKFTSIYNCLSHDLFVELNFGKYYAITWSIFITIISAIRIAAKALECREHNKKSIAEQHCVLNWNWPPGIKEEGW